MRATLRMTGAFLKVNIREKSSSFWVMIYPLILMLLMYAAFSGLQNVADPDITVGIAADHPMKTAFQEIGVAEVFTMDEAAARDALEDGTITAYIRYDGDVMIAREGIDQEIVRAIMTEYRRIEALWPATEHLTMERGAFTTRKAAVNNEFSVYFYNVFAMFSLYGYFGSMFVTELFRGGTSQASQRIAVSPVRPWKGVLAGILSSAIQLSITMIMLYLLSDVILGLDLIQAPGPSAVVILLGMFFGITQGLMFGAIRMPAWARSVVGIVGSLLMAFLSGMMSVDVRNAITVHAPIIHRLNPVSRLTESFFRVNVFGDASACWRAAPVILAYAAIFIAVAVVLLRRRSFKHL